MPGYSVTFSVVDQATAQIEAINRRIRQMREPIERQQRAIQQFVDLSGLKKVADSFTSIARTAGAAFSSMVRLVPVMGALTGAASIAGLASLVKGWDDLGQQLTEDSTRIGTTSQSLELLQNATTLAGGDAATMTQSLKGLTETLGRAQLGDAQAASWFRRAGIALRDVNGNLRTSTEVLPEVISYINSLSNPMDRARVAAGLGAESLAALAEQFQRSGKTMPQWLAEAQKFAVLTEEQQQSLQRYRQATGELTVAFGSLKEQIGATLGEALTPLIKEFSEWVRTHQPQIIAAVQRLSAEFKDWIQSIDWSSVAAGAREIGAALEYLVNHLDQVKLAAEVVAGVFAAKWAIGVVGAIGQVTNAIGVAGALGVGGLGLLGALGGVVFLAIEIIQHFDEIKQAGTDLFASLESGAKRVGRNLQDWYAGRPGEGLPKPGETPGYPTQLPTLTPTPGYPQQPTAPGPTPGYPEQPAATTGGAWATPPEAPRVPLGGKSYRERAGDLTNRLERELNLTPAQAAGLVGNLGYESAGLQSGIHEGGTAADKGGIGWAQWTGPRRREFEAFAKANNLDVKSDQANEAFLMHELRDPRYAGFMNQLRQAKDVREATSTVLHQYERPADPAASQQKRTSMADIALAAAQKPPAATPQIATTAPPPAQTAPQVAAAPPVATPQVALNMPQMPAPQLAAPQAMGAPATLATGLPPPVSGSVDVNITHTRPPPGTRLSASATGDVNLSAPRTEHQQLSSVA